MHCALPARQFLKMAYRSVPPYTPFLLTILAAQTPLGAVLRRANIFNPEGIGHCLAHVFLWHLVALGLMFADRTPSVTDVRTQIDAYTHEVRPDMFVGLGPLPSESLRGSGSLGMAEMVALALQNQMNVWFFDVSHSPNSAPTSLCDYIRDDETLCPPQTLAALAELRDSGSPRCLILYDAGHFGGGDQGIC